MLNIKRILGIWLLWSVAVMASLSTIYNTATPGGGDDPRLADDEMRLIKAAIQERMNDHNGTADEGDHYWPLVSSTLVSNVDTGQHRMVTLRQMTDNPSTLTSYSSIADLGFLYQKDVSGNGELYWQDEAANVLQLTTAGLINLGGGAIWDGVFKTSTSDTGDSKSISLTSGGAYGVGRGAGIILYGNEYGSGLSGQLVLEAGYSTGTTKAVIDVKTSIIDNLGTPTEDDHAATKGYVDDLATPTIAVGTSSISNTSGAWADMTDMSITVTTIGTRILMMFSATCYTGNNGEGRFRFDVDGSPYHTVRMLNQFGDRDLYNTISMQYLVTGLTAGSHTVKVQWYDVADTVYNVGGTYPRVLIIQDCP